MSMTATLTNVTLTSLGSPTNASIGSYSIIPSNALGAGLTNYSLTLSNGTDRPIRPNPLIPTLTAMNTPS